MKNNKTFAFVGVAALKNNLYAFKIFHLIPFIHFIHAYTHAQTHTYPSSPVYVRTFISIMCYPTRKANPNHFNQPPDSGPDPEPDLNPFLTPALKPSLNPQTGL